MVALIIALVEHPQQSEAVRSCLSDAGHAICLVDSFDNAKKILHEHSFDMVISDVHLENGGSVFDFLKWIKKRPDLRNIPFVLLSLQPTTMAKYLADGVRTTARLLGAAKYIAMDTFDSNMLIREVNEVLRANPRVIANEGE